MIIYKISFPNNPKVYIGKTVSPNVRWYRHQLNARNDSNLHIHCAMRKYGIENAIFEVIATCLEEEYGDESEIGLIAQYDSFRNGYNMTTGGEGSRPSEETRRKLSELHSGENNPFFGKRHTKESKKKNRDSNTGKSRNSKVWKLYFEDGRTEITDRLKQWCIQNGYNRQCIAYVRLGKHHRHKDIIKVEYI